ncbi:hypothetical protein WME75_34860 [Sorangium sp. So ce1014]|uniref:hypothetical protein n=1 Tax=Sorangium sp. So ce1014 TaxID=3133326 RepID=UPI003F6258D8
MFERAAASPEARLLGLEICLKWTAVVDARLKQRGLGGHVRALNADAREARARRSRAPRAVPSQRVGRAVLPALPRSVVEEAAREAPRDGPGAAR